MSTYYKKTATADVKVFCAQIGYCNDDSGALEVTK